MQPIIPRSDLFPSIAISLLFACTLFYNGVGHSPHWLALAGIVLLAWLSASITALDATRTRLACGWFAPLALAYAVWLFVNPLLSRYPFVSSMTAMQLALLPLGFLGWLLMPSEDKEMAWNRTHRLLLFGGIALAVWGTVDFLFGSSWAHGPLIDANAYAALINLFLIPTAFSYLRASPTQRGVNSARVQLFVIALLAVALFMSLSRGALISLVAVLPILLWLNRRATDFRPRAILLLAVLAVAFVLVKTLPLGASKNVETLLAAPDQAQQDSSVRPRLLMWKATWRIIREEAHPLIGTGLGTYKNYYATYREAEEITTSGNLAHNDYLQALQEGGLVQLGFLLALTVFAPLLLLMRVRKAISKTPPEHSNESAGLLLAISAVSLHAMVNFTHYVAPIALLTGLYLARSWESLQPIREVRLLPIGREQIKPAFAKTLVILLLAVPVGALAIDGIIFKLFASKDPWIARLSPKQSETAINVALALRPANPRPRTYLIQDLLNAANQTTAPVIRIMILRDAEREALALTKAAPALASGRYFLGTIRSLRGRPEDLQAARADLEHAVELVPPSAAMRLALLRLYRRLGLEQEARQTIREAKKWYMHEPEYGSLAAFAREAEAVAASQKDTEEAAFWASIRAHLAQFGYTS